MKYVYMVQIDWSTTDCGGIENELFKNFGDDYARFKEHIADELNPEMSFMEGSDVDLRCVHMTYLQLALAGVPAIVRHQNSLTRDCWSVWYTPSYLSNIYVSVNSITPTITPNPKNKGEMLMKRLDSAELRALCIRNNWFTCGDIRQYRRFFERNSEGAQPEELATILWICSDDIPYEQIYTKLCKVMKITIQEIKR